MKKFIYYITLLFTCGCASLVKSINTINGVSDYADNVNEVSRTTIPAIIKSGLSCIGLILSFILAVYLFKVLKSFIMSTFKKTIKENVNCDSANIEPEIKETFSWDKFKKIFTINSGAEWAKSVKEILDARKLIIYGTIIAAIYGFAYFKGISNAPVQVNMEYNKEWIMNINGEEVYKPKFSNDVYIRDSKTHQILKHIKAKDMGILRKKLKPIGFIFEPIAVGGLGIGKDSSMEGGLGLSLIKSWRYKIDTYLTQKGIYLGTHYQLTENSGPGIAVGKGYEGDNRVMFYYSWKF
jgi:hypothetical protein